MRSGDPPDFDWAKVQWSPVPPSDDWDTQCGGALRAERGRFVELRQQPGGMDKFEKLLAAREASEGYVQWYRGFDELLRQEEQQAQELADTYKLEVDRVKEILRRTSIHRVQDPLDVVKTHEDMMREGLPLRGALQQALDSLPADLALSLFEAEDLTVRTADILGMPLLVNYAGQLRTLDEFERLTDSFMSYLERNREHLISRGVPENGFERASWLERLLGKLYPVKLPVIATRRPPAVARDDAAQTEPIDKDPTAEYEYEYKWARAADLPEPVSGDTPDRYCDYDHADLLQGLDSKDADRLVGMREKVFDLKAGILRVVLAALKHRTPERPIWADCVELLTERLTAEELEFLLRMDQFYADYSPRPAEQQAFAILDSHPGGLGNLLQAIWPYEEELTVGLWWRTREALNDMVELDELARPYLSIDDYFSVVATPQQPLLDQALYRFRSMQERAIQTWGGFKHRVRALPREFYVSVTVPREQETRLQAALEHVTRDSANFVAQPPRKEEHVFVKEGKYWRVVYQEQERLVKDTKGMYHIQQLVSNPGQEIHVRRLDFLLPEPDADIDLSSVKEREATPTEEGLESPGTDDVGPAFDGFAEDELKQTRDHLRQKEADAKATGDLQTAANSGEQAQEIEDYLSKQSDVRGRPRKQADPIERVRKRVSKRIHAAIKRIKKAGHKSFAEHLNGCLQIGKHCAYIPEESIDWLI